MSPKKKHKDEEEIDIDEDTVIEPLSNNDEDMVNDVDSALAKIKKLKAELIACKADNREYLDGWQRLKADVANSKKMEKERALKINQIHKEQLVLDLLPIIDNFDMARQGNGWQTVDATWRTGVEAIISQIESLLANYGATRIGDINEDFDPVIHEAMSEVEPESKEQNNKIVAILRSGWKIGDSVLRPAQVTVANTK